jgi:predicted RNA-binding Zn-ribbon protein involved in translation (DUF1610 family)
MGDTLSCSECGTEVDAADELEADREVAEVDTSEDGSIHLFENRDLFLCENCKNPLGISRS